MPSGGLPELPSYGGFIALSFVSLGLVCLAAYVGLRWLGRLGIGRSRGPMRVLGRCLLEPRRSLYVVEVAGRFFLLAVGDGPTSLIAELDAASAAAWGKSPTNFAATPSITFAEVLARALGRTPALQPAASAGTEEDGR